MRNIHQLIKVATSDPEVLERANALFLLGVGSQTNSAAISFLLKVHRSKPSEFQIRWALISSLMEIVHLYPEVYQAVLEYINDQDSEVRYRIVRRLGTLSCQKPKEALTLAKALKDDNVAYIRTRANEILKKLCVGQK